ncbi:hypothetical protein J2Y69_000428 [Microbacterium resistens]|uniref:Integrase n=1 Tax=Microbacterium resistens TaxID=156977 RepID=A0ABU1S8A4_9MICO|nr:hypothetical protein [Microbacterium resistens]MDR6865843.1 hypothetical protein [Microbacterium resistens]
MVDGAGLPASMRRGCSHTVAWYARGLAAAFHSALAERSTSMREALGAAISTVTAMHSGTCRLGEGSPSATVAAWRIEDEAVDVLVLCDASVVLHGRDGSTREITDDRIEHAVSRRAAEILAEHRGTERQGRGIPSRDEVAAARFAALDATRNVDGGFWCAQTDPSAADRALVERHPLSGLRAVIAASDGGTRGFQLVGAHSLDHFARLATEGELETIVAEIRSGEDARSTASSFDKPHDDIAIAVAAFA